MKLMKLDEEELEADACPSQAAPRDLQVSLDRSDYSIGHTDTYHQGYIVPSTRSALALRTSSEIQYLPSLSLHLLYITVPQRNDIPHRGPPPSQNKSDTTQSIRNFPHQRPDLLLPHLQLPIIRQLALQRLTHLQDAQQRHQLIFIERRQPDQECQCRCQSVH